MDTRAARELNRMRETLELLSGERGGGTKPMSALRRGELQPLASLSMQSAQITAAPTMDDYNALQADVAAIFTALSVLSNRLGNAKLPTR
jgi:hypothetical protein